MVTNHRLAQTKAHRMPGKGHLRASRLLQPRRAPCTSRSGGLRSIGLLGAIAFFGTSGCAVHYYDKQSGTEHLWGFGHLKMRAVPRHSDRPPFTNAVMAYATGTQTLGFSLGAGEDDAGVGAGWNSRSRLTIKAEDSSFYLIWPTNSLWLPRELKSFFNVRVGSDPVFTQSPLLNQTNKP